MTYLTVRQAAERAGVSRQTMFRHIKDGRVSSSIDRDGQKQIDVAELLRVFGELQSPDTTTKTTIDRLRLSKKTAAETPQLYQIELEKLRVQLDFKDAELALAKERISELKTREHQVVEEKNRLLTLIEQQSRLLAAPTSKAAPRKRTASAVAKAAPKAAAQKTRIDKIGKAAAAKPAAKAPAKKRTDK